MYMLQRDYEESNRLNEQSKFLRALFNNFLIHPRYLEMSLEKLQMLVPEQEYGLMKSSKSFKLPWRGKMCNSSGSIYRTPSFRARSELGKTFLFMMPFKRFLRSITTNSISFISASLATVSKPISLKMSSTLCYKFFVSLCKQTVFISMLT